MKNQEEEKTEARWHDQLGKVMFTPEHAANLDAAELKNPSGWTQYKGQDQGKSASSSKSGLNAAGDNTDSRKAEESNAEQSVDSKGKKSGK